MFWSAVGSEPWSKIDISHFLYHCLNLRLHDNSYFLVGTHLKMDTRMDIVFNLYYYDSKGYILVIGPSYLKIIQSIIWYRMTQLCNSSEVLKGQGLNNKNCCLCMFPTQILFLTLNFFCTINFIQILNRLCVIGFSNVYIHS